MLKANVCFQHLNKIKLLHVDRKKAAKKSLFLAVSLCLKIQAKPTRFRYWLIRYKARLCARAANKEHPGSKLIIKLS